MTRSWLSLPHARTLAAFLLMPLAMPVALLPAPAPAAAEVSFARDVAPVILKRCAGCHGERVNLGGYRTHTFASLLKPGASGAAPIVAGNPKQSQLFRLITAKSVGRRMPKSDDPLSADQIELVRKWIVEGARFDGPDRTALLRSLLGPRRHPAAPATYRTPAPIMAVAFAPGGGELIAGGYYEATVWNSQTGGLLRRLQHLPQRIQTLAFSSDGKKLLVAGGTPGDYGELALVDPATGARNKVLDTAGDIVLAASFSRNGKLVAAGGADATVRLYDVESGRRIWTTKVHSDWVTSVSFSSDGRFLASASKDMTVKVFEVQTGALFTTYNGHARQIGKYQGQNPVYAVRFAPEGLLACSAGGGRWIQFWDPVTARDEAGTAADMEERFARQGHTRYIEHGFEQAVFSLAVRGGQVFAASADGVLKQFDMESLKEVRAYRGHTDWLFALDYDPAAHRVATGAYNGEIRVWDTTTGACVVSFRAQPNPLPCRTISTNCQTTPDDWPRHCARITCASGKISTLR